MLVQALARGIMPCTVAGNGLFLVQGRDGAECA
jgi:hypothetical protein